MRVVVGDVKRSVKREDWRTDGVLLGLGDGPLVRIGGTTGATNGSVSNTCLPPQALSQDLLSLCKDNCKTNVIPVTDE